MQKKNVYLSVIIPAHNEEDRIGKTLDKIHAYLKERPFSYEIIVVSAGSTDGTTRVVRKKMQTMPHLDVLEIDKSLGKGHAVREGMLKASGRIRLFTDADNSTDISHFDKMRPLFDKGYEVVICSRHPWDAKGARQAVSQAWHKRLLGMAGNIFIQIVAIRGIWDTQCGFKAFRDFAAEKLFHENKINGWGFDIEILALSKALGYKIGVIPAYWINDLSSQVGLSAYVSTLLETVKIRINFLRGRYEL